MNSTWAYAVEFSGYLHIGALWNHDLIALRLLLKGGHAALGRTVKAFSLFRIVRRCQKDSNDLSICMYETEIKWRVKNEVKWSVIQLKFCEIEAETVLPFSRRQFHGAQNATSLNRDGTQLLEGLI